MAVKYSSLREALEGEQVTQVALAEKVAKQRRRRANGAPLRLSQTFVSQLVNGERVPSRQMAIAISDALGGKIDAATLILGEEHAA